MDELLSSVGPGQDWEGILVVDIDAANFSDDFTFETAMRFLSLVQQVKVRQRKTEKARHIALCNRLLQLFGCSIVAATPFDEAEIEYGSHGKPYLKNHPEVAFSMSNGEQYVVQYLLRQGGTRNLDVGIDIAAKSDYTGLEDLNVFRDIFSDREYEQLEAFDNGFKGDLFAYYWSLKECYTKFTGLGLNCDLSKIDCGAIDLPSMSAGVQRKIDEVQMFFHSTWMQPACDEIVTVCRKDFSNSPSRGQWLQQGPKVYRIAIQDILLFFEKTRKAL